MYSYLFTTAAHQVILALRFDELVALKAVQNVLGFAAILCSFIANFHFDFVTLEILFYNFVEFVFAIGTGVRGLASPDEDAIVTEFVIAAINFG